MRHARTADISVELAGQLRSALDGRVVIEQAKGLLAGRDGVGIDDAFRILRMRARNERRSVADVAAETVSSLRSTPR
jgi:AmiR/NasT family two-component response regulator